MASHQEGRGTGRGSKPGLRPSAVVLAAGLSRRMGSVNKLLIEVEGEPLVRRSVGRILAAGWPEVVVVLGFEAEAVEAALADLQVRTVVNPDYEHGQVTSIRAGLAAVSTAKGGVAVCLADQIAMTPQDYTLLEQAWRRRPHGEVLIPFAQGRRGNPIILSSAAIQTIEARGGRFGCRQFVDDNADLVFRFEMPNDHVVRDIDRPEDLEQLGRRSR